MNFEASRAKALDKLNYFVENNLSEYSKLRNFDFDKKIDPIFRVYLLTLLTELLVKKK